MRKILLSICCVICFACCNVSGDVEYLISDKYVGPCIIFIYSNKIHKNFEEQVVLDNGLGRILEKKMAGKFYIKSLETGKSIDIVPIGKDKTAQDSVRHIFQLSKGNFSSGCWKEDIQAVTFFIGTKGEYDVWYALHQPEYSFFEAKGVDWCRYYLDGL